MIFKSSKNQMVLIEKLNNNKKNYLWALKLLKCSLSRKIQKNFGDPKKGRDPQFENCCINGIFSFFLQL
jgi:hypothetical protein